MQFGLKLGAAVVVGAVQEAGAEHEAGPAVESGVGVESELDHKPVVGLAHKPEEDNLAQPVVGTVEHLADTDSNIDIAVGKDHIQDTADSIVGIAAGIVATVLQ